MNLKKVLKAEKVIVGIIIIIFFVTTSFIITVFSKDQKKINKINDEEIVEYIEDETSNNSNDFKIDLPKKIDTQSIENVEEKEVVNTEDNNIPISKPKIIFSKKLNNHLNYLNGYIKNHDNIEIFKLVSGLDYKNKKLDVDINIIGTTNNGENINLDYSNILNISSNINTIKFIYQVKDKFDNIETKEINLTILKELNNIIFTNGYLDSDFNKDKTEYILKIDNLDDKVLFNIDKDEGVDVLYKDNVINENIINIDEENNFYIKTTLNEYHFKIEKAESSFNSLKTLKINEKDIKLDSFDIDAGTFYTTNIDIKYEVFNLDSQVNIEKDEFKIGRNNIKISVNNHYLIKTYNISFMIEYPTLENLQIENYDINFQKDIKEYTINLLNNEDFVNINAVSNNGEIDGNGKFNTNSNIIITVKSDTLENKYKININNPESRAEFKRPLDFGKVTQKFHNGIDIGGINSTIYNNNVYASYKGKVINITYKSSCGGNTIFIEHNLNNTTYTTVYAHLKDVLVNIGDYVTTETIIGKVGGNPNIETYDKCSTGPHLHYAIALGSHKNITKEYKKNTEVLKDYNISKLENKKGFAFLTR